MLKQNPALNLADKPYNDILGEAASYVENPNLTFNPPPQNMRPPSKEIGYDPNLGEKNENSHQTEEKREKRLYPVKPKESLIFGFE